MSLEIDLSAMPIILAINFPSNPFEPLMSLREYIYFETGKELPKILDSFDKKSAELASKILKEVDVLKYFKNYKEHGTKPFYHEGNFRERMKNVIEKSIYADIPYFVGQLSDNHLGVMKAIIGYLAFSKIPTVNIETMCRDWALVNKSFTRCSGLCKKLDS